MASIVHALKFYLKIKELEGLTPHEKLMLFILMAAGDPDGTNIHPSNKRLVMWTGLAYRTVTGILASLKDKGYLVDDGRLKYERRYKLNIPGATIKLLTRTDISQEEWESQWTSPDEDDSPTDKRPVVKPPDDDATVKVATVKPPPAVPTTSPPGPTPEEKRQKDIDFLWSCVNQARRGVPTMTFERFMKSGQRKGIPDDELEWMWTYDFDVGGSDSLGSQPNRESPEETAIIPEGLYQP